MPPSPDHPGAQSKTRGKRRVLFLAGAKSHGFGEHAHAAGCHLLAKRINQVPEISATVIEEEWPEDSALLHNADALVFYCDGEDRHLLNGHEAELEELPHLSFGFIHYATTPAPGPAFDFTLKYSGGVFERNWSVNPFWTADYIAFHSHPATNGLRPFAIEDEWYYHLRFPPDLTPGLAPLLVSLPPDATLRRPDGPYTNNRAARRAILEQREPQTMAWAYEQSPIGPRGFGFTGGHYHWNWAHPDFRRLVLNAIVWLAGADVPPEGVRDPSPSWDELMTPLGPVPTGLDIEELRSRIARWNRE